LLVSSSQIDPESPGRLISPPDGTELSGTTVKPPLFTPSMMPHVTPLLSPDFITFMPMRAEVHPLTSPSP
jgi:hypothetical protein